MTPVWLTIERFLAEHGAIVLVTLAEAAGSSPCEIDARMVVRRDGRFSGTIWGGALEWLVLRGATDVGRPWHNDGVSEAEQGVRT